MANIITPRSKNQQVLVQFAVIGYPVNAYVYMKEQPLTKNLHPRAANVFDVIDDPRNLDEEFVWGVYLPKVSGVYNAVIEFQESAIDDFELRVLSCTMKMDLSNIDIGASE